MLVETYLFPFTVTFQIEEQLVFCRKCLMTFNVIDKLLVAILAESLKVDAIGCRLPLEVKQISCCGLLPGCEILWHLRLSFRNLGICG